MSLEQAIVDLTAAVTANTSALKSSSGPLAAITTPVGNDAAPVKRTRKPAAQDLAVTESPAAIPVSAASTSTPSTVVAVSYEAAKNALMALAEKDRASALKILNDHGGQLLSEIKPEKYASFVAAATAAMTPQSAGALI